MDTAPKRDMKILMGDLNSKVLADNSDRELIMGKHGIGVQNENMVTSSQNYAPWTTWSLEALSSQGNPQDYLKIHWRQGTESDWQHHHRQKAEELAWRQGKARIRCSIWSPPGCSHGQDKAESPQRAGRKTIIQVQRTQSEEGRKGKRIQGLIDEQVQRAPTTFERKSRRTMAQSVWDLEDNMQRCHGEEDQKTYRVDDNGIMNTDQREKATERPGQPDTRPNKNHSCKHTTGIRTSKSKEGQGETRYTILLRKQKLQLVRETWRGCMRSPELSLEKAATPVALGKTTTGISSQAKRSREHDGQSTSRKHSTGPAPPVPTDIPPPTELLDINNNQPTDAEVTKAIKSLKSVKEAGPESIPPEASDFNWDDAPTILQDLGTIESARRLETDGQTDRRRTKWSLCVAMLRRRHKKGYLVKLPLKGDLSSCNNLRAIMLLSFHGKLLSRFILERLKTVLDKTLRD